MASTSQNYELWENHDFLGTYEDVKPDPLFYADMYQSEILSESEWIDFEKLPDLGRKLMPFVLPLGRGKPLYEATGKNFRFKPAYMKAQDVIDPLMPLTRRVGIDRNYASGNSAISPMERLDLIRSAITQTHVRAAERTWNYMAAVALRDGRITLRGEEYPDTLVDFQRAAGHTITLAAGSRFGQTGVSIVDFVQLVLDTMGTADFGGAPEIAVMGGGVWSVMRKDEEFLKHLDINLRGASITFERGLVDTTAQRYKVGEMMVGGASGSKIELWVDNSTYIDPMTKVVTRYIGNHQMLFLGSKSAIGGVQVFGRIIDRDAEYQPMRLFPKNWLSVGDVTVEYITHKSAPLFVPINANATLLANVIAP